MAEDNTTPNPGGDDNEPGEDNKPQGYLERRAAELRESKAIKASKKPETKAKDADEPKPEDSEEPEEREEAEEEDEGEDEEPEGGNESDEIVLSQIDYDKLDADSAKELGRILAKKLGDHVADFATGYGSSVGPELGKLRGELRTAKEEARRLREGLDKASPNANAFSHVQTSEELDKEEKQLQQLHDYYEEVAIDGKWETNDDGEEGVYDGKKFYPKSDVKGFLRQWRKELGQVPARRAQLKQAQQAAKQEQQTQQKLSESFTWFSDQESDEYKKYSEIMDDSQFSTAFVMFPGLKARVMEMAATMASGDSRRKITIPLRSKPKPSGGGDSGAGGRSSKSRALATAEKRVKEGNFTPDDWALVQSQKYKGKLGKFKQT